MSNGSMKGVIDTHQLGNQERQICHSTVFHYCFDWNRGVVMAMLFLHPVSSFLYLRWPIFRLYWWNMPRYVSVTGGYVNLKRLQYSNYICQKTRYHPNTDRLRLSGLQQNLWIDQQAALLLIWISESKTFPFYGIDELHARCVQVYNTFLLEPFLLSSR